ncbi:tyrosine-type recombinase/integrase [Alkalicoccus chagannorensis]|uniref:tyrosine-type recombinase/integrase n=1 Tax=Alkalicoccus chagannorensis TaxID=427072 RepID=UPI00041C0A05|nr:site-specific integrase [Alkalicoccus chagannorensis]
MANIEKRGEGRYRLTVFVRYDENGKQVRERKTVSAKNVTEAKKMLTQFEADILGGTYVRPEKMTLSKFYDDWLHKYAEDVYAYDTIRSHKLHLINRILPAFGHKKLSDIKTIHVVNLIETMKKPGSRMDGGEGPCSTSSIRNMHKAFTSVMGLAKQWGLVRENPCDGAKPPPMKRTRTEVNYDVETINRIAECIKRESLEKQVLFWVAFITSARQGEICALEEKHVLKEQQAIYFEQSLTEVVGEGIKIKSIKNNLEGAAAIPTGLMDMIDDLLRQRRKEKMVMRDKWLYPETIFVFADETGKPRRPDSISQWWNRFLKRYNLPYMRFHDLRHFSITYLIEKNVPMKSISDRARHARIDTTMNLYGHKIIDVDRLAASHFDSFLPPKSVDK